MNNLKLTYLLVLTLTAFVACMKTSTNSNKVTTDPTFGTTGSTGTTTGTGNGTSGSGTIPNTGNNPGCHDAGTGPQSEEYYELPNIVAHGKGANIVAWSSASDPRLQTASIQGHFVTDARFNIRVLAYTSPGQGTDTYNNNCAYMALPYTKLQVKVGVKTQGAFTYNSTYTFNDIPVDGCSGVHSFSVPQSAQPLIIEVLNVKWDYSCTYDKMQNFNDSPRCPWDYVWPNDCYEIGLQLSTDYTKDMPH